MTRTADALTGLAGEMTAIRRDLHAHPELGLSEHRTSALVARLLGEWGYQVTTGIGKTGVVGTLSSGASGRSIGLRADMDALPIDEQTNLTYASRNPGLMHACGHDGHTAMLLGAAHALSDTRAFDGTLHVIFQPAEENFGGAKIMMDDGLFRRFPCDAVFGMHNMPGMPEGHLGFRSGELFAAVEEMVVTLRGRGGHGATPHQTTDSLVAGAALVMALQTIVARNVDPLEPAVVTVGAFNAGHVSNVIADEARLVIGARAFSPSVADLLRRRIRELATEQARSFGVVAEVEVVPGYPVLTNDPQMTTFARSAAVAFAGAERVTDLPTPQMGGEDFAFMLQERPGSYLLLGQGPADECRPLHHPGYDFNDRTLLAGAGYWCALVEAFLPPA